MKKENAVISFDQLSEMKSLKATKDILGKAIRIDALDCLYINLGGFLRAFAKSDEGVMDGLIGKFANTERALSYLQMLNEKSGNNFLISKNTKTERAFIAINKKLIESLSIEQKKEEVSVHDLEQSKLLLRDVYFTKVIRDEYEVKAKMTKSIIGINTERLLAIASSLEEAKSILKEFEDAMML